MLPNQDHQIEFRRVENLNHRWIRQQRHHRFQIFTHFNWIDNPIFAVGRNLQQAHAFVISEKRVRFGINTDDACRLPNLHGSGELFDVIDAVDWGPLGRYAIRHVAEDNNAAERAPLDSTRERLLLSQRLLLRRRAYCM